MTQHAQREELRRELKLLGQINFVGQFQLREHAERDGNARFQKILLHATSLGAGVSIKISHRSESSQNDRPSRKQKSWYRRLRLL